MHYALQGQLTNFVRYVKQIEQGLADHKNEKVLRFVEAKTWEINFPLGMGKDPKKEFVDLPNCGKKSLIRLVVLSMFFRFI